MTYFSEADKSFSSSYQVRIQPSAGASPASLSDFSATALDGPLDNAQTQQMGNALVAMLMNQFGLTQNQGVGIVASLMEESFLNPSIMQGGSFTDNPSLSGDVVNQTGYGIAQWGEERKQGLIDYAASHGLPPSSERAQAGFMIQELSGSYSNVITEIKAAGDSATAACQIWTSDYEQAADPNISGRLAYISAVESWLTGKTTPPNTAYLDTIPAGGSFDGPKGHGTTLVCAGDANSYTISPSGDGSGFTLSSGSATYHIGNVTALQFGDQTDIVAQTPAAPSVTTGNIAELYGAVFGRMPDVAGLGYYQNFLAAEPNTPLLQFAKWFLASPEYTGNAAHNYAETTAGDAQFITDSYQNLLHRTPSAVELSFYQDKVIRPMLSGLTPGTAAYTAAEHLAHAQVLVYFSASPEFLSNVQITAAHPSDSQHWLILI